MSLIEGTAMNGNVGNPYTTGHYVRLWISEQAKEHGHIEFTAADVSAATGESHNRVSAMLCVLRKQGHISVIGKIKKKGNKPHASNGGYKYLAEWENVKELTDLPPRTRAKPYTVDRGHGTYKSRKYMTVPYVEEIGKEPEAIVQPFAVVLSGGSGGGGGNELSYVTGGVMPKPPVAKEPLDKSVIEELLNIGIDLQERGENRDAGLRLLKLTERIFRNAK